MSTIHSSARFLCLIVAVVLSLAREGTAQNAWEVSPNDAQGDRRIAVSSNVGMPDPSTWGTEEAGTVTFHAEATGPTVTFSCTKSDGSGFVNDVSLAIYSDSGYRNLATSGFVRVGNTVVTATPIAQAGDFYGILTSGNGGGTTYFRHTYGIHVKAAPVEPVKTGLQLTPPAAAQLPGASFTITARATNADGSTTTLDGSSTAFAWTFDTATFTRSGSRFTVTGTAPTSSQTISARYTAGGSTLNGSCTVQVTKPAITALALSSIPTVPLAVGRTFTPVITATMSAGPSVKIPAATATLTWVSDPPSILSVTGGVVTVTAGTVDSATLSVQSGSVVSPVVTVPIKKLPATVVQLTAVPATATLSPTGTLTPSLSARMSDGSTLPLTAKSTGVTWVYDATFTQDSSTGAFSIKAGTTAATGTITGKYGGKAAPIAITITRPPTLVGLSIVPVPAQRKGDIFTPIARKIFSDGTSTPATDARWSNNSGTTLIKLAQGQFRVNPTTTASSGRLTARCGNFSASTTVPILPTSTTPPTTKTVTGLTLQVPATPVQKGASFTPTVQLSWSDGSTSSATIDDPAITCTVDTYVLAKGLPDTSPDKTPHPEILTVLTATRSTLGKITVSHTSLKAGKNKTTFVPIAQSSQPQKSLITSHQHGQTISATTATFVATIVTADHVTMRIAGAPGVLYPSADFGPGQIPKLDVEGLHASDEPYTVQATSYFNGRSEDDQITIYPDIVGKARALDTDDRSYGAPEGVPGSVGANAFVLEAAGLTSGVIKTPYSLYQFFETAGKTRQRAASEVGAALLSAIPDGAIVFFLDPSMTLPWERPQTTANRSVIVSRKAYGDVGIWDAERQLLINLHDGFIVGADNFLTMYDGLGTGSNFTSKFVYGWVTARDFRATYSVAAAEAFQASEKGEVGSGVVPSAAWLGRLYYSTNTTPYPLVARPPTGLKKLHLTEVVTAHLVNLYILSNEDYARIYEGNSIIYISSEGTLRLNYEDIAHYTAIVTTNDVARIIQNVPSYYTIPIGPGTITGYITTGAFALNLPNGKILHSAGNLLTVEIAGHVLIVNPNGTWTIDGRSGSQIDEGDRWLFEEFLTHLPFVRQPTQTDVVIETITIGMFDNYTFAIAFAMDVVFNLDSIDGSSYIETQQDLLNEIKNLFPEIDSSSATYFIASNLSVKGAANLAGSALSGIRAVVKPGNVVAFLDKSGNILKTLSFAEFRSAAQKTANTLKKWGRLDELSNHFRRHATDFGAQSEEEYVRLSQEFLDHARQLKIPAKVDADGIIRIWEASTNTFAVYNANRTTATFYKPDILIHGEPSNLEYWNSQRGVLTTNY